MAIGKDNDSAMSQRGGAAQLHGSEAQSAEEAADALAAAASKRCQCFASAPGECCCPNIVVRTPGEAAARFRRAQRTVPDVISVCQCGCSDCKCNDPSLMALVRGGGRGCARRRAGAARGALQPALPERTFAISTSSNSTQRSPETTQVPEVFEPWVPNFRLLLEDAQALFGGSPPGTATDPQRQPLQAAVAAEDSACCRPASAAIDMQQQQEQKPACCAQPASDAAANGAAPAAAGPMPAKNACCVAPAAASAAGAGGAPEGGRGPAALHKLDSAGSSLQDTLVQQLLRNHAELGVTGVRLVEGGVLDLKVWCRLVCG